MLFVKIIFLHVVLLKSFQIQFQEIYFLKTNEKVNKMQLGETQLHARAKEMVLSVFFMLGY